MSWPEALQAKKENRHELILFGKEISTRISQSGLDNTLFDLTALNYLDIHETCLEDLPKAIEKLVNLQTLVLHSNKLTELPTCISRLSKLKILDLSQNDLVSVPDELADLTELTTLNLSHNMLESFPALPNAKKLNVLNLFCNKLASFPDVCSCHSLAELLLSYNAIKEIPSNICQLGSLKVFNIESNFIEEIPGELCQCSKLKDANFTDNPITDKRLLKLITQCHTKQVLDYIKQQFKKTSGASSANSKKGKKGNQSQQDSTSSIEKEINYTYKISVRHFTDDSLKVIVLDSVKEIRQNLVACLVLNLEFNEDNFKKFIQLQTKLHDTLCDKRNVATIATHDFKKLGEGDLTYTSMLPGELMIKPLNRPQVVSGSQLFKKLQAEADTLRKEKKRNTYSGIHKYLYLLEGKAKYPCLLNANKEVISFPPITNSETTKIGIDTTSLLIEITSATSQTMCKKIGDTLLKEMLQLFGNTLTIQQVRNVDVDGNLKSVYPSRSDLVYEDVASILVERE